MSEKQKPGGNEKGVNDIRQMYLDTVGQNLGPKLNDDFLKIQDQYNQHCEDLNDNEAALKAFKRLFDPINMGDFTLYIPRQKVQLNLDEIFTLMKAKIKISTPERKELRYIVGANNEIKGIVCDGESILLDSDEAKAKTLPYRFSVTSYKDFYLVYNKVVEAIRQAFGQLNMEEFREESQALLDEIERIAEQVDGAVWDYEAIEFSKEDLRILKADHYDWEMDDDIQPEHVNHLKGKVERAFNETRPVELNGSLLWGDSNAVTVNIPESVKPVVTLQQDRLLPSIFDEGRHQEIAELEQHFDILLDVSGSTEKNNIYQLVDLACAAVERRLKQVIPNLNLHVIPYESDVHSPIQSVGGFIYPLGGTATERAFQSSVTGLKNKPGSRSVIHLFDGAPNNLHPVLKMAPAFPGLDIAYSQIVFAQDIRKFQEVVQRQCLESMGADSSIINVDKYASSFTRIAEAAEGINTVLWISSSMAEAIVSLYDVMLGQNFLRTDKYKHLT